MKKTFIALLVLAILLYVGIVLSNDRIAEDLRKQVAECMLPPNMELVDSVAVAGKMEGNGNGMQYFGAVLLHSALDEGPLRVWYEAQLPDEDEIWISVSRQRTPELFEYQKPRFRAFEDDGHYWCVMLARYSVSGAEDSLWEELLDCDIRGH